MTSLKVNILQILEGKSETEVSDQTSWFSTNLNTEPLFSVRSFITDCFSCGTFENQNSMNLSTRIFPLHDTVELGFVVIGIVFRKSTEMMILKYDWRIN